MAQDLAYPEVEAPLLWVSHRGFLHATGEELRSPQPEERRERVERGLNRLDGDFGGWLVGFDGESADGVTLRFRDVEAARNVASKLRDYGLEDR